MPRRARPRPHRTLPHEPSNAITSSIFDRALECGWLFALAFVPCFFNLASARHFEADKAIGLRVLVLGLFALSIAKALHSRNGGVPRRASTQGLRSMLRAPLALPVLGFVIALALATLASVAPRLSFWGSYERGQGAYTQCAYVAFFVVLAVQLRTREQLDRIVTLIIQPGVAVALYALVQTSGLDPIAWAHDVSHRASSTMGNAGSVGGYLIMVTPFVLFRLGRSIATVRRSTDGASHPDTNARPALVLAGHVLFLVQLWWMAALPRKIAALSFVVFLALVTGAWAYPFRRAKRAKPSRRAAWARVLGYGFALVLFLLATLSTQSRGPQVGLFLGGLTFLNLYLVKALVRKPVRRAKTRVWKWISIAQLGSLAVVLALNFSHTSAADRFRQLPYVGRIARWSEFHDGTGLARLLIWRGDAYGKGALGLVATDVRRAAFGHGPETLLDVYGAVFPPTLGAQQRYGISPDRAHQAELDELIMKGFVGLAAYVALFGAAIVFAVRRFWRSSSDFARGIYAACLSAIVAHLVEGLVGIPVTGTVLMAWVAFAMLVVMARLETQDDEVSVVADARASHLAPVRPRWGVLAFLGTVAGLLVWRGNLSALHADTLFQEGRRFAYHSSVEALLLRCEASGRAIAAAPSEDHYLAELGAVLIALSDTKKGKPTSSSKSDTTAVDCGSLHEASSRTALIEHATRILRRAYELRPLNKDRAANVAQALVLQFDAGGGVGALTEAIRQYEIARRLAPNDVLLLNQYASAFALSGPERYTEAEALFARAKGMDPEHVDTYVRLGDLLRAAQRPRDAANAYAQALRRDGTILWSDDHARLDAIVGALGSDPADLHLMVEALDSFHAEQASSFDRASGAYRSYLAETLEDVAATRRRLRADGD